MSNEKELELEPSELGTKEYWDETYEAEIQNFKDFGDGGEVWFGNGCAIRIIEWIKTNNIVRKDENIIDLGCGNGMLLIKLAKEGWKNLVGVDYSANAIELATSIAKSIGVEITYKVLDILSDNHSCECDPFALALDKGTYDAISLSPDDRAICREKYISYVKSILKPGGILILTSCNWTEEELKSQFCTKGFQLVSVIPSPKFQFGGATGNNVTSVVLKKDASY